MKNHFTRHYLLILQVSEIIVAEHVTIFERRSYQLVNWGLRGGITQDSEAAVHGCSLK